MSIYNDFKEKIIRFSDIRERLIPGLNRIIKATKKRIEREENYDVFNGQELVKDLRLQRNKLKSEEMDYFYKNHVLLEQYFVNLKKIEMDKNNKTNTNTFFNLKPMTESICSLNIQYLKRNGNLNYDYVYDENLCNRCNTGTMTMNEDNQKYCSHCFHLEVYMENNDGWIQTSIMNNSNTCYVRLNHFKRIILNFNGVPTMTIDDDVIETVRNRLTKNRVDVNQIQFLVMKRTIKQLHLFKYNDQINYFIRKMSNQEMVFIDEKLCNKLCLMFLELQSIFNKIDTQRHNFFGYRFILCKFLMLLNQVEILNKSKILINMKKNVIQEQLFNQCIKKMNIKIYFD